jgi:hypothetical protein
MTGLEMVRMTRKTFSGLGRPRSLSPTPREPNGQPQRPTREETRAEVIAIVAAQPHRRDGATPDDPRRESAIGRLILDGLVTVSGASTGHLFRAAELYLRAYADLRWILDSRRPWANSSARPPAEPTEDDKTAILRAWGDVHGALRRCCGKDTPAERAASQRAVKAAEFAILDKPEDERVLAQWIIFSLPDAMRALVRHYELVD